jgi:hypothetical protein
VRAKPKYTTYELRYDATAWSRWELRQGKRSILRWGTKRFAIAGAADYCRDRWERFGEPCKLLICRRDDHYCKGRNGERSFGVDSKRRPG